ncbi:glutathione S-transferase-like isoform X1 [Mytilus edulis]|uniref:GST n=2 Tax=Mytilus edulis TaxID=6550 RepID=A0A8S3U1H2_MYTED|nr:GST [Mytilus edulis]
MLHTQEVRMTEEAGQTEEWELFYHHFLIGRSAYIRLIFEELGIPYKDMIKSKEDIMKYFYSKDKLAGFPVLFPPVIRKGDFQLGQTSVICKYLGEKYGLVPDNEQDKWRADMINTELHDYLAQGRLAFHGINPTASYFTQVEETKPYIERFAAERIPKYLSYFESVLKYNNGGKGFLFGDKLTYVDLTLFWVLKATEASYPDAWKSADCCPLLKLFRDRIERRPNIAAYLNSDRFVPLENNSMM